MPEMKRERRRNRKPANESEIEIKWIICNKSLSISLFCDGSNALSHLMYFTFHFNHRNEQATTCLCKSKVCMVQLAVSIPLRSSVFYFSTSLKSCFVFLGNNVQWSKAGRILQDMHTGYIIVSRHNMGSNQNNSRKEAVQILQKPLYQTPFMYFKNGM